MSSFATSRNLTSNRIFLYNLWVSIDFLIFLYFRCWLTERILVSLVVPPAVLLIMVINLLLSSLQKWKLLSYYIFKTSNLWVETYASNFSIPLVPDSLKHCDCFRESGTTTKGNLSITYRDNPKASNFTLLSQWFRRIPITWPKSWHLEQLFEYFSENQNETQLIKVQSGLCSEPILNYPFLVFLVHMVKISSRMDVASNFIPLNLASKVFLERQKYSIASRI